MHATRGVQPTRLFIYFYLFIWSFTPNDVDDTGPYRGVECAGDEGGLELRLVERELGGADARGDVAVRVEGHLEVGGIDGYCSPRHQTHSEPSFLELLRVDCESDASSCMRRNQAFALAPVSFYEYMSSYDFDTSKCHRQGGSLVPPYTRGRSVSLSIAIG